MKPVIGITVNEDYENLKIYLSNHYFQAVEKAGGLPILLPPVQGDGVQQLVGILDGLILSGGVDVDPFYIGEEPLVTLGQITPSRDKFELSLASEALRARLPIFAICRGVQLLNIAAGGTIYQDIYTQLEGAIKHNQDAPKWHPTHKVTLKRGSRLQIILGEDEIRVNSFHHQALAKLAFGFKPVAVSCDGIVEAIEKEDAPFVLGVQWHPECMWKRDIRSFKLFQSFVKAASFSRKEDAINGKNPSQGNQG